ncbi:MAG: ribosomal protein methyltransferase [Alphaproteobacteria bacterium]|jgi:ribosomal protein L11 methyltransferase|nr:ribosomal protein methyltransferase [Alphaproteobacteria bacterium]
MVDNAPKDGLTAAGHSARLVTDRATAQRLADFLTESLDEQNVVVAAFESDGGKWTTAIYFSDPPNETATRALIALELGAESANALVFERVETRDWVAASLEGLAPVAAGRFLVYGRHDRARLRANRIGIEIEAALAFGTGHHGTTRGCLLALDYLAKRSCVNRERAMRPRVLDVGTGTGVLAIAAAKALQTRVLASDIDPRALTVARENARLNSVAPAIEFIPAGGLDAFCFRQRGPFDLILANILLGPLQRLARPLARLLAPGAHVVLSGLLNNQGQAALIAYRAQGLVPERRIVLDEWTTLVLRRPMSFPALRRDKRALPR